MTDVIVIGAGASGLVAARDLVRSDKKVLILEARNRIGGRVYSYQSAGFSKPVELGAEMVHGNLPITLGLLREYDIPYHQDGGEMWTARKGVLQKSYNFFGESDELERRLRALETDMTVKDFLGTYFSGPQHESLRNSAKGFVEGYDAADYTRASAFKFRDEWLNEEWQQYSIEGGYMSLLNALADDFRSGGGEIYLEEVVTAITWQAGKADIKTASGKIFSAGQVLITVPLGVLSGGNAIQFEPEIPGHLQAAQALGFGPASKILLEFTEAFWAGEEVRKHAGKSAKNLGFLLSDAPVPTWWTQFPDATPILTGWLAGSNATRYEPMKDEEVVQAALHSLAYIFGLPVEAIAAKLKASKVMQWAKDPFAQGGYHYATVNDHIQQQALAQPVADTLYFAGEALYKGKSTGTVEAALASGIEVVKRICHVE